MRSIAGGLLPVLVGALTSGCTGEDSNIGPDQEEAYPFSVFEGKLLADPVITSEGFYVLAEIDGAPWFCYLPPPARQLRRLFELSALRASTDHQLTDFSVQLLSEQDFFIHYLGQSPETDREDFIGLARLNLSEGLQEVDTLGRPRLGGEPVRLPVVLLNPNLVAYIVYQSQEINLNNFSEAERLAIAREIGQMRVTLYNMQTDSIEAEGFPTGIQRQRRVAYQLSADGRLVVAVSGGNLQNSNLPTQIFEYDFSLGPEAFFSPVQTTLRDGLDLSIRYIAMMDDPGKSLLGSVPEPAYFVYGQDRGLSRDYLGVIPRQGKDTLWAFDRFQAPTYITDFLLINNQPTVVGYQSIANAPYGQWPEVYNSPTGGTVVLSYLKDGTPDIRGSWGDFARSEFPVLERNDENELVRFELPNVRAQLFGAKMFGDQDFFYIFCAIKSNQVYHDLGSLQFRASDVVSEIDSLGGAAADSTE